MRILLDTGTFLWILEGSPRVSESALRAFRDAGNEVFLSSVSAWEIVVKHGLGRLPLPEPPWKLVAEMREALGVEPLPLEEGAALKVGRLPSVHRDPFDRMLICQALTADLTILTPDETIQQYPVKVLW